MYVTKLSKTPITEGHGYYGDPQGYKSWIPDCPHVLDDLAITNPRRREDYTGRFIHELQTREIIILNRGRTNNEIIARYVLRTLSKRQLLELRFMPVIEIPIPLKIGESQCQIKYRANGLKKKF